MVFLLLMSMLFHQPESKQFKLTPPHCGVADPGCRPPGWTK